MTSQLALLPLYLTAHLQLTLCALLVGVGVSVPLGVLLTRVRRLEAPVMALASITQTIPALALLAVMVPLLAAVGFQSIGFLPAFIGLVLYSMLPILRNTVAGLDSVEEFLLEAARGVGMTPAQCLRRVELPLAMPVIVAGIRTSAVWTVGMATLSTPVGAPSLGNYIFSGLQTRNLTAILFGCVAASALALLLDALVRTLERAARARNLRAASVALGVFAALYVYTGVTMAQSWVIGTSDRVVIGAKTFTEQYILSAILERYIEAETKIDAKVISSLGSTVAYDALSTDQIDVYVDYSGTLWATILKRDTLEADRAEVLKEVGRYVAEHDGIEVVAALGFENAYALAMRDADGARLNVRRISELAPFSTRMTMGGDYEFFARPEWSRLRQIYDLNFMELRSMDATLMYPAAAGGTVDVIGAFSTDGRIAAFDLRVLDDDRHAIPPYDAVVLAGSRLRAEHPEVIETLRRLAGAIDAEAMRRMNREVDEQGRDPGAVAEAFVRELSRVR